MRKKAGRKSTMSRQLRRQHRLRQLGRCIICNRPAARKRTKTARRPVFASRCASCLEVQRLRYYRLKSSRSGRRTSAKTQRARRRA
jgi:hypothetical protein